MRSTVYDPWLPERELLQHDPAGLEKELSSSDAVFVFASVTSENQGFLGAGIRTHPAGRSTGDKSPAYFLVVPPGHTGTATALNR